jgi:hypothetical protein
MSHRGPVDLQQYAKVLYGRQFAVGLHERTRVDRHVCFTILSKDDGNWFIEGDGGSSSYWLADVAGVLAEAMVWCKENCDPYTVSGLVYGWKFRG